MSMIDNADFEPTSAFSSLISSHSLEELLLLQNNLSSEIRSLDTNMQTLVYENYNKFISATDTIRSMKTNVESMESEMKRLESSMLKVQEISNSVSTRLEPKQKQIKELINVYDELQKIKSICDLPSVLKAAIEKNKNKMHLDYLEAAKGYAEAIGFLIQHKADSSYASIYLETNECVDRIRRQIWEKANDMSLSPESYMEYCKELKMFGEDGEKLPIKYCSFFLGLFHEKIDALYAKSDLVAAAQHEIRVPTNAKIESLFEDIRTSLESNEDTSIIAERTFAWYVLQVHEKVIPIITFAIGNFIKIFPNTFQTHIVNFCKEVIIKCITNVKNKLKELGSGLGQFCCALHHINEDLHKLQKVFPNTTSFVLSDRFTELFEFLIRFQIEKVIENLQNHSINTIKTLHSEISTSEDALPEKIEIPAEKASFFLLYYLLAEVIRLEPMLDSCKAFISSGAMIVSLIISHLLNFFQILRKNLTSLSISSAFPEYTIDSLSTLNKNGNFLIGLLKLLIYLEESVPRIIAILTRCFIDLDYDRIEVNDIMNRIAKPELLVVLKLSQEDMLLYYIEHYSKLFNDYISEYCSQKWKFQAEPIDISTTICQIVQSLLAARKELKAFFRGDFTSQQKIARKRVKHNVELEMERLFARKTKVIENLKFDIHSIIGTLAKITMKGLYEEIRMQDFGTGGGQQVEVDAHFLASCLSHNILEESLVSGYVQEIVNSAKYRCTLFEPLQSSILESIVENKKNQMNLKQTKG